MMVAFLILLVSVARSLSVTCDEVPHIGAGYSYVKHGEVVLNLEHPPLVKLLAGLPLVALGAREIAAGSMYDMARKEPSAEWFYGDAFLFVDNRELKVPLALEGADSIVFTARLAVLVFPVLLAAVAYLWARRRFGPLGGLLALGLVVTYPDLLGHGALVTTDAPLAALALACGFALDVHLETGSRISFVAFALSLGLALAVKFTALLLVPVFFAVAFLAAGRTPAKPAFAGFVPRAIMAAFAAVVVLWIAYLGELPFGPYWTGLARARASHPPPYDAVLFGRHGPGFWGHYLLAVTLVKAPLGTLGIFALLAALARRIETGSSRATALLLHATPLVLFLALSFLAPPLGSRYGLPAIPFLCVSAGRLALWARTRARWGLILAALAANAIGVVRDHPFHATATNGLAGSSALVYRNLDESNVDWGGGLKALAAWQRAHDVPSLAVVPFAPQPFTLYGTNEQPYLLHQDPEDFQPGMTHLDAYGVSGQIAPADVLFAPAPGHVYAVSAHVLACAEGIEQSWGRIAAVTGKPAPPLALGESFLPTDAVGGFLIFDRR
jgi:hypothetical protein